MPAYEEQKNPPYPDPDRWMDVDLSAHLPEGFAVRTRSGRVLRKADLLRVENGIPPHPEPHQR